MKLFLTIIFTLLLSVIIFAQDTLGTKPKFIVKADIALPIVALVNHYKEGSFTTELGFHKRHSLQIMGLFSFMQYNSAYTDKSFQILPMYKFFLFKKKFCHGFYTGVNANFIQDNFPIDKIIHNTNVWYRYNSLGGGLILGYQTYIKKRLVIDALIGSGIKELVNTKEIVGSVKFDNKITYPHNPNFYLIMAVNIGYKF